MSQPVARAALVALITSAACAATLAYAAPPAASAADAAKAPAAPAANAAFRKSVTPAELAARRAGRNAPVVLDVRAPGEFAEGHVPGAINVPHDQVEARLAELRQYRDREVVVYCRSGRRAGHAAEVLQRHGFTKLEHLAGDMPGWTAAGQPVARP
jgi:phage shock protein E